LYVISLSLYFKVVSPLDASKKVAPGMASTFTILFTIGKQVKCLSQRTLFVRNIGKCEAKFQLSTCSPFSVEPSIGTLGVGQSMQVTVEFLPKTTGDHSQVLLLHYHSGIYC
ncbi:hypothetical protein cypCar_00005188, partial [Cyprinus carpio]